MKEYLLETFKFNDRANKTILRKIKEMEQPDDAINLFSHLIHSQNKWMARITGDPAELSLKWFAEPFVYEKLEQKWTDSLNRWLVFLENMNEDELNSEVRYNSSEGNKLGATIKDIALQLNYHSIHHRAQICMLLRMQKINPPFIEYIGSVVNRY